MRISIIKCFQSELNLDDAILILDKAYISYIVNLDNIEAIIILKSDYVLLGNTSLGSKSNIKGTPYNRIGSEIRKFLKQKNIKHIYCNFNYTPVSIYMNLKYEYEIYDINTIIKDKETDRDVMIINTDIVNYIIRETIEGIKINDTTIYDSIRKFKHLAYSFDITDCSISISDSKNIVNLNKGYNVDNIYYFDVGIKYQGLYSDYTFCKKFSDYNVEEIKIFEKYISLHDYIINNISNKTPGLIYKEVNQNYNIEIGFGHVIHFRKHDNYSLNHQQEKFIPKDSVFTVEPILYYESDSRMRLETMYDNYQNELYEYLNIRDMIIE